MENFDALINLIIIIKDFMLFELCILQFSNTSRKSEKREL